MCWDYIFFSVHLDEFSRFSSESSEQIFVGGESCDPSMWVAYVQHWASAGSTMNLFLLTFIVGIEYDELIEAGSDHYLRHVE